MVANYSGALLSSLISDQVRRLIMEQFNAAFLRVSAALDELEPSPEDENMVFGFNAYFAVQRAMRTLDGVIPDLTVESIPNQSGSANHALMHLPGMVGTFSSAHGEGGMPRPAKFREALMQARLFDTIQDGPVAPLRNQDEAYVQFVYGRVGHEISFVKAVCVTSPKREVTYLYRIGESAIPSDQVERIEEADWFDE